MSQHNEIDLLEADIRYRRERIALLRSKQYRLGLGSTARLEQLERELERYEERLRALRLRGTAASDPG